MGGYVYMERGKRGRIFLFATKSQNEFKNMFLRFLHSKEITCASCFYAISNLRGLDGALCLVFLTDF